MAKKYGYMIKTARLVDGKIVSHYNNRFEYPQKKGALVEVKGWNPKPECGGGIHGLIHETRFHYIQEGDIWLILKYLLDEAVEISQEKIKVPRAWVIAWGTAEEIQKKFEELTGKPYQYQYAVQTAGDESVQTAGEGSIQKAEYESIQIAGYRSTQEAEYGSVQVARGESTQKAGYGSTQKAERRSTQIAGNGSVQIAGDESVQTAGEESVQTAGEESTQKAGRRSTQIAGCRSTQIAEDGSISIIRGQEGFCQHEGKVMQILTFYDGEAGEYVFLHKLITDNKKHYLRAIEENGEWKLIDTIIEE